MVVLTLAGTLLLMAVMTVTGAVDLIQLSAHGLTLTRIQEVISAIPASGALFGACCVISPRNRSRPVKNSGGKRAARTPPARSDKDDGA